MFKTQLIGLGFETLYFFIKTSVRMRFIWRISIFKTRAVLIARRVGVRINEGLFCGKFGVLKLIGL